jgi:hypothetical protein
MAFSPRMITIPCESAGLAISGWLIVFLDSNSYCLPAFTTNTSPSSLGRYSLPSAANTAPPEKSVRTTNFGSAAGCEARLCRAVSNLRDYGLCPGFGLWPLKMRAKPEPGAQRPFLSIYYNGRAEFVSRIGPEYATVTFVESKDHLRVFGVVDCEIEAALPCCESCF